MSKDYVLFWQPSIQTKRQKNLCWIPETSASFWTWSLLNSQNLPKAHKSIKIVSIETLVQNKQNTAAMSLYQNMKEHWLAKDRWLFTQVDLWLMKQKDHESVPRKSFCLPVVLNTAKGGYGVCWQVPWAWQKLFQGNELCSCPHWRKLTVWVTRRRIWNCLRKLHLLGKMMIQSKLKISASFIFAIYRTG